MLTVFIYIFWNLNAVKIIHYDTGVEGHYLPHDTFLARAKQARTVECGKNHLTHQCIQYFIPQEPNNHIKVMIFSLEWYEKCYIIKKLYILNFKIKI